MSPIKVAIVSFRYTQWREYWYRRLSYQALGTCDSYIVRYV